MQCKSEPISAKFKIAQSLGANQVQIQDEDVISTIKYDKTGDFISVGDKAGRIIIFKKLTSHENRVFAFDYHSEFQSHSFSFDALKSTQCSSSVSDISWLRSQGKYMKMLTTNKKQIKLWRIFQTQEKRISRYSRKELSFPKLIKKDPDFKATLGCVFPELHSTQINSISQSNNQEYVLSTDDQRSFYWNLEKPKKPYVVNQINQKKSKYASDLFFTCSKMHPWSDSIFAFGLNKYEIGVGLCDIRVSHKEGRVLSMGTEKSEVKNVLAEIIGSTNSISFANKGKYLISRQYLNVKVWDLANTKKPLQNICIQQGLKSKLVSLFESDNISDRFSVSTSQENNIIATGNYNNCFHLIDVESGLNTQYQLNYEDKNICNQIKRGSLNHLMKLDVRHKTTAISFHPFLNQVAVASQNCFFIYSY